MEKKFFKEKIIENVFIILLHFYIYIISSNKYVSRINMR